MLQQPSGTVYGDVTVSYTITDAENNLISMHADYSTDSGSDWQTASVTGDTSNIAFTSYAGSLVWQTGTDLEGEDLEGVWFRVTPRDNEAVTGAADVITVSVDNKPPEWITATGSSGDTTIAFWFDELVADSTATKVSNFTLTGGLTIDNIAVIATNDSFAIHLTDGQTLPGSDTQLSLSASNISDIFGNVITAPLDTIFYPLSGEVPSITIDPISGTRGGDVTITYTLADNEQNLITIRADYSIDSGTSWQQATVQGDTSNISSANYSGSLTWQSATDLPDQVLGEVSFRIIPRDHPLVTGEPAVVTFRLDNKAPEWMSATGVAGDTIVTFWFSEQVSEATATDISNFTLSGSLTAASITVTTQNDTFALHLTSGHTLPFGDVTLQTTGIQDLYGNTAGTLSDDFSAHLNNDNPEISLSQVSSEVTGDVAIDYQIQDTEGDLIRLIPEYSEDGGVTWQRATTSSDTLDIESTAYSGSLTWYSITDLSGSDLQAVRFRITPTDNVLELGQAGVISFHLDNNEIPTLEITQSVFIRADSTWTFQYLLSDAEWDLISIVPEYSTDDGLTWHRATTASDTTGILPAVTAGTLIWETERDLPLATMQVLFRITPRDNDVGTASSVTVYLNVLDLPILQITSTHEAEQAGDIVFSYQITDDQNDQISLTCEYTTTSGDWQTATVIGQTSSIGSSQYSGQITWNSATDLPGTDDSAVEFRITPFDFATGFAGTVSFHLDNNAVPSVVVTAPTGIQSRDVSIGYVLQDNEDDVLELQPRWSLDKSTWQMMSVTGDTSDITSAGYSGTLIWDTFADLGYTDIDSVWIRCIPVDIDTGAEYVCPAFSVVNYVGDYSGDAIVGFSDFATLIAAWNSQDTYHDIGPATGAPPALTPDYDGVIDFEDMMVFVQMWNWSAADQQAVNAAQGSPLTRPQQTQSSQSDRKSVDVQHPVILTQPPPDDVWADDGIMRLNVEIRDVAGVSSAGIVLHYDVEHLRILDIQPGTFLGRVGSSEPGQVFIKRIDEDRGRIEVMGGRISPDSPSTSGGGVVARLQFEKLSQENSSVHVSYDLRDETAEQISSGSYQSSVDAVLEPDDFALLNNYPNPFNGETIIRFQLPSEQRVQLYIFNVRGQRVATLVDEQLPGGYHKVTWSGRNDDGRQVASGIYIYLIQAGPHRQSKKMTIIK